MGVVIKILKMLQTVGASLAAIAMLGCFGFGIYLVLRGFCIVAIGPDHSDRLLIDSILDGLELLFIAPLPFLAFRSITKLIVAWVKSDGVDNHAAQALKTAQEDVGWVKRFIAGLMIAVVSTYLIHLIFAGGTLDGKTTETILGLIAALSLYYWTSKR